MEEINTKNTEALSSAVLLRQNRYHCTNVGEQGLLIGKIRTKVLNLHWSYVLHKSKEYQTILVKGFYLHQICLTFILAMKVLMNMFFQLSSSSSLIRSLRSGLESLSRRKSCRMASSSVSSSRTFSRW